MAKNSDYLRKEWRTLSIQIIVGFSILLVYFILAIVAVVIGAVFRWQCQIQTNIPVYLIVAGVVTVFYVVSLLVFVSIDYDKSTSLQMYLAVSSFESKI